MLVLDAARDIARLRSGDRRYRRPRNLVTFARRRRWHEKISLFVLRREKPSRTRAPNALAVRGDGEALAGMSGRGPSACRLRPTGPSHRHGTLRPRNRIRTPVCSRDVARWRPLAGVWVPNHPGPFRAVFGASGMLQKPGSGLTDGYGRTVKVSGPGGRNMEAIPDCRDARLVRVPRRDPGCRRRSLAGDPDMGLQRSASLMRSLAD